MTCPDGNGVFENRHALPILDHRSLDQAMERCSSAALGIIDQMLPDLRLGAVLRSLLDATLAGTAGLSQGRDEARFVLLASALASGRFEPDAVPLSAAILLLETGLCVLDHDDPGRRWTFPLAYSPKILSAAACTLLGALPAALVQSPSDGSSAIGPVLSDLLRVAADRLDRIEASGSERAEMLPGSAVVRLSLRLRRPAYAVLAARMAGVPLALVETHARFGRSLGIAQALRGELRDMVSTNGISRPADHRGSAPMALFLAQADRRDRDEMQRLLPAAEDTPAARTAIRHRLHRAGIVAQIELSIQQHCALARRDAAALHPKPGIIELVASEIAHLLIPETPCRARSESPTRADVRRTSGSATGKETAASDQFHPA